MPKVRFEIEHPEAEAVFVAGDFNDWDPAAQRLRRPRKDAGTFVGLVEMPPGRYEFKYVVDGDWMCCPQAPRVTNEFGTENSVVEVG